MAIACPAPLVVIQPTSPSIGAAGQIALMAAYSVVQLAAGGTMLVSAQTGNPPKASVPLGLVFGPPGGVVPPEITSITPSTWAEGEQPTTLDVVGLDMLGVESASFAGPSGTDDYAVSGVGPTSCVIVLDSGPELAAGTYGVSVATADLGSNVFDVVVT